MNQKAMKNITPEEKAQRTAKAKATKDAQRIERESKTIHIEGPWNIKRYDEMNWCVWKDGEVEPRGFYGNRLVSAFKGAATQMLSDESKASLKTCIVAQERIYAKIEEALGKVGRL